MKVFILTFLFLVTCSFAFGQDYKSIVAEADGYYESKEFGKSVSKYKAAFKIEQTKYADLYDAACSAALSGDEVLAFKWLNLALKNGFTNMKHLQTDEDLTTLRGSKKWEKLLVAMQKELDKKEANYDKPLRAELLAVLEADQAIRKKFIAAQKEFGYESKQVKALGESMLRQDSANLIKVTGILDRHGWIGPDKVGEDASIALFLVIQHSGLAVQQKYLPMLRDAVKSGKAQASHLAALEDRVALREGRKQVYGSQIHGHGSQKYYIAPLEDPDNVDKRRAEVGLGLLTDYVKRWDIVWNVAEYKKQLPEIEAKEKERMSESQK